MRLVTRNIWRAFPELDRFSEEQCRRFVAAARRGRLLRLLACLGCGALIAAATMFLLLKLGRYILITVPTAFLSVGTISLVWIILGMLLALMPTFVGPLLLRDRLIRRQLRHTIDTRGTCGHCRYVLLGLKAADDLTICCPECGHLTVADESMGELVTDEALGRTFRPSIRFEDPEVTERHRRRLRKLTSAGLALAIVATVTALVWSTYEGWATAHDQALSARGQYHLRDFRGEADVAQRRDEMSEAWTELQRIFERLDAAAEAEVPSDIVTISVFLRNGVRDSDYWSRKWDRDRTVIERFIDRCASEHIIRDLGRLGHIHWEFDESLSERAALHGHGLETAAAAAIAYAYGGARKSNVPQFLDGIDATLTISRFVDASFGEEYGNQYSRPAFAQLLAHAPRFADRDALIAASQLLARHEPSTDDRQLLLRQIRARHLNEVSRCFATPGLARKQAGTLRPTGARFRVGRYEENVVAIQALFDELLARADRLPYQRQLPIAHARSDLWFVEEAREEALVALRRLDVWQTRLIGLRVAVAVERYIFEQGTPPATLSNLGDLHPGCVDPFNGEEFRYGLNPILHDYPPPRPYRLSSVGPDQESDGGSYLPSMYYGDIDIVR